MWWQAGVVQLASVCRMLRSGITETLAVCQARQHQSLKKPSLPSPTLTANQSWVVLPESSPSDACNDHWRAAAAQSRLQDLLTDATWWSDAAQGRGFHGENIDKLQSSNTRTWRAAHAGHRQDTASGCGERDLRSTRCFRDRPEVHSVHSVHSGTVYNVYRTGRAAEPTEPAESTEPADFWLIFGRLGGQTFAVEERSARFPEPPHPATCLG